MIGRTRTTPKPNLPGPEFISFLYLHADSALSGSGEYPGLMYWQYWMTSSPCGAPLKICQAPPGCCCWSYKIHRRSDMANQVALPVPTELRDRREDAASGATCPICFRDTGYAGGHCTVPYFQTQRELLSPFLSLQSANSRHLRQSSICTALPLTS